MKIFGHGCVLYFLSTGMFYNTILGRNSLAGYNTLSRFHYTLAAIYHDLSRSLTSTTAMPTLFFFHHRLEGILPKRNLSPAKRDELKIKFNILNLKSFVEPASKETISREEAELTVISVWIVVRCQLT
jgi:Endoplasmic reticulum protein ERp29, C-terminal domain